MSLFLGMRCLVPKNDRQYSSCWMPLVGAELLGESSRQEVGERLDFATYMYRHIHTYIYTLYILCIYIYYIYVYIYIYMLYVTKFSSLGKALTYHSVDEERRHSGFVCWDDLNFWKLFCDAQ